MRYKQHLPCKNVELERAPYFGSIRLSNINKIKLKFYVYPMVFPEEPHPIQPLELIIPHLPLQQK